MGFYEKHVELGSLNKHVKLGSPNQRIHGAPDQWFIPQFTARALSNALTVSQHLFVFVLVIEEPTETVAGGKNGR